MKRLDEKKPTEFSGFQKGGKNPNLCFKHNFILASCSENIAYKTNFHVMHQITNVSVKITNARPMKVRTPRMKWKQAIMSVPLQ